MKTWRILSSAGILGFMAVTAALPVNAQERIREVSLDQCIQQAIRDNLNLREYHLGLRYNDLSITQAESSFDPSLSLSATRNESETPNFFEYYNVNAIQQENTDFNVTFGQDLVTGATWGVGLYTTLSSSNIETTKNYTSNLGIKIDQPLLRGFGSRVNTSNIYIARINSERSMYNLEQQANNLVSEVTRAFWNLVYARQTLAVHEISIEQADSLLAYNRKGFELGVMTESDVLEAQSALASRRQEALNQQNTIDLYEDQLRRLLNITSQEDWDIRIVPTDLPRISTIDTNPEHALELAFSGRPDYRLMQKDTEQYEISTMVAKNALLPNLNLSARYRLNSSGETIGENYRELGDTDAFGWTLGLVFNYPIGNRYAKTDYEKRQIDVKRSQLRLEYLESQIRTDIRTAIRNLATAREQIDAAGLTVEVNELKLKIEEERFRNHLSSSYYVLQFQRDLANSRNLYNRALIDYVLAAADYQLARGTLLGDYGISIITDDN